MPGKLTEIGEMDAEGPDGKLDRRGWSFGEEIVELILEESRYSGLKIRVYYGIYYVIFFLDGILIYEGGR